MSRIAAFWKPPLASTGIPGAPDAPGASPTPLVGHRLMAARLLWLGVVLLCEGLLVASLPQRYAVLLHPTAPGVRASLLHLGFSTAFYAAYHLALEIIPALGFLAMALVIYVRRSDEWPAIFVSLVLVAFGAALPGTMYTLVADQPIWGAPYPVLEGLGWFLLLVFAYLFPDGRFAPRWIGWLTPVWAAWVVGFFALAPVLAPRGTWLVALTFVLWIGWFGTGVLAQTYRYLWTATPMQRQQTKWVVLGLSLIDPGHPSLLHIPHKPLESRSSLVKISSSSPNEPMRATHLGRVPALYRSTRNLSAESVILFCSKVMSSTAAAAA